MKTNKLLLGVLAAGMFMSCTNDDVENNLAPPLGEVETSYIAVNVNSVYDITRAGDYEEGTAEEQKVNKAIFFFFDNAGAPFVIANEIGGTGTNYIEKSGLSDTGNDPDNVETITSSVLTITGNKGTNPAKVVAVVNWDYAGTSLALSELKAKLVSEAEASDASKGFVMSNSVYLSGTTVMDATPITAANIFDSESAAKNAPLDIYVERVAVKVALTQGEAKFDTGLSNPYGSGNLYVKILGWDVNTTLSHSNMVKTISEAWTDASTGITGWNLEAFKRSFWAQSVAVGGDVELNKNFTWNGIANAVSGVDYCLENTSGENTKVLVKAQVVDASDAPVTIVKFLGEYITIDGLKNSVANALVSKYYAYDGSAYTGILPADIEIVAAGTSGVDSYTVTYKLNASAEAKSWYVKDGETYTATTVSDINSELDALIHAQVWNEGMAYFFADIKHLDSAVGVVRNHYYNVNIEAIQGLGTPVYNPNSDVVEPVTPSDTESYIAARINVLTWRLVNQNVILQ